MRRLTHKEIDCLLILAEHARTDISYREGGTYWKNEDEFDKESADKAEKAIEIIKEIVLNNA